MGTLRGPARAGCRETGEDVYICFFMTQDIRLYVFKKIHSDKSLHSFLVCAVRDCETVTDAGLQRRAVVSHSSGGQRWESRGSRAGSPGALRTSPAPASLPAGGAAYEPQCTHRSGGLPRPSRGPSPVSPCAPNLLLLLLGHLTLGVGLTRNPA